MATYSVNVDLTLNFSYSVEAESTEDAERIVKEKVYKDYLTKSADGMDAEITYCEKD